MSIDAIIYSHYTKYLREISYNQPAHFFKLFINLSKLAVLRAQFLTIFSRKQKPEIFLDQRSLRCQSFSRLSSLSLSLFLSFTSYSVSLTLLPLSHVPRSNSLSRAYLPPSSSRFASRYNPSSLITGII